MPTIHFQAAIFDLDGTLADTIGDIAATMNQVLIKYGFPPRTETEYRQLVGRGLRRLAHDALPPEARDPVTAEACYRSAIAAYQAEPLRFTIAYPGIIQVLNELRARRVPLAVHSNKADAIVQVVIGRLFGVDRFALTQGARDGIGLKPDPSGTARVLAALGTAPESVLYIGDSEIDVETGHAAGLRVAGAVWGFRGRAALAAAGADYLCELPADLLAMFR